jgi:hypothetical protein
MMKDPFVRFHPIPSYEAPREFRGQQYVGQDWSSLDQFRDISTSREILTAVRDRYIGNQK